MIDMLSKVLKKKFEKGPMKVEIHVGSHDDQKKGTDLAPEVEDKAQNDEMSNLQSMLKGEPDEDQPMDRKPTFEEKAKTKMKARMASLKGKK